LSQLEIAVELSKSASQVILRTTPYITCIDFEAMQANVDADFKPLFFNVFTDINPTP